MNTQPGSAASPRHAALLMHAMPEGDREWLLASLPPQQRTAMQDLLSELRSLGIPPDATLLDQLRQAVPMTAPRSAPERLAGLDEDGLAALSEVLAAEPPELTARLLAAREWPWKAALLAKFERSFAQRLEAVGSQMRAPALEHALCETLVRQLPAAPKLRGSRQLPPWRLLWFRLARKGQSA
jgi:hypothetical protein